MTKTLPCPSCKFDDCIRVSAISSVAAEIDSDGDIFPQGDLSNTYDIEKHKIFCSTCGVDLKLEEIKGKFRLAQVPEEKIAVPKVPLSKRIISKLTGTPSRAEMTT